MKQKGFFLVAGLLVFAGCGREEIKVYRVAKEDPSAVSGQGSVWGMPSMPSQESFSGAQEAELHWHAPESWRELAPSGMRLASFEVPGRGSLSRAVPGEAGGSSVADLSVTAFPGEAGGVLANVNRWRGQIGLGALDEAGLAKNSKRITGQAGDFLVRFYRELFFTRRDFVSTRQNLVFQNDRP